MRNDEVGLRNIKGSACCPHVLTICNVELDYAIGKFVTYDVELKGVNLEWSRLQKHG